MKEIPSLSHTALFFKTSLSYLLYFSYQQLQSNAGSFFPLHVPCRCLQIIYLAFRKGKTKEKYSVMRFSFKKKYIYIYSFFLKDSFECFKSLCFGGVFFNFNVLFLLFYFFMI